MGKKVYNAKARQNLKTIVDSSTVKDIKLELSDSGGYMGYDEANALVLPSKKRATKIEIEKKHVKILSKKQRKHLQAIVTKKYKKEGRAELLEKLSAVQIPDKELQQFTSITQVQTVGLRKLPTIEKYLAKKKEKQQQKTTIPTGYVTSIKGLIKRKLLEEEQEIEAKRKDTNYVSLDDEDDVNDVYNDNDNDVDDDDDVDVGMNSTTQDLSSSNSNAPKSKTESSIAVKFYNVETTKTDTSEAAQIVTDKDIPFEPLPKPNEPIVPLKKSSGQVENKPSIYVPVHRTEEVQAARLRLPILAEEQQVMETINENAVTIIAGETGSGKTTQIPQFLYEAGYALNNKMIGITEPRRVAAIAMSKRVAQEMNLTDKEVSYLIRFEGNVTPATRIKFMTDGVLLKEIESDFLLTKYSVIILDEAHERSSYTDILVGLLSRIVPLRHKRKNQLKLIIMSATLRLEDFTSNTRLFKTPPPLLKVEARQFPVTIHFQKRTPENYLQEAYRKVLKIHSQLPDGGILVFLTGQLEVNQLVRKLRRTFPYTKSTKNKSKAKKPKIVEKANSKSIKTEENQSEDVAGKNDENDLRTFDIRNVRKSKKKCLAQMTLPKINLDDYKLPDDDTECDMHETMEDVEGQAGSDADDADDPLDTDDDDIMYGSDDIPITKQPLWVLPLYSLLSSEKQNRIFQAPPNGCRLCVVSTNIAETSLTIPNIKYVVDTGRQKVRLYDKITGISAFVVTYTSKASADQRAGRAGRVSAGHCYRIYSSGIYQDFFEDFCMPDIQKKPVDNLMLQMRCMGIDHVINFPFPSPPDEVQLHAAEKRLTILGALEKVPLRSDGKELPPIVTRLGHIVSRFPVLPRFGKMLALSHQQNLLPYSVCLVAALSVQEVLMETGVTRDDDFEPGSNKWLKIRQNWAGTGNYRLLGDPMVLLGAVGGAEYAGSRGKLNEFCVENGLRLKAITEVRKLRKQLTNEINLNISNANICVDPAMQPPTDAQARFLRQILLAGLGDNVAHKVSLADISDKEEKCRFKYAYNIVDMEEPVYMHSSTVLRRDLPEWIIYQEAYELQNDNNTKMFIRGITAIEPEWLLIYVPLLCNVRQVREDPAPRYNSSDGKMYCYVDATFGKAAWELPLAEIVMPDSEMACGYFAMFLLDGQVCPKLTEFKPKLKSTPSSLVKSWSNLNLDVTRFKRAIYNCRIQTRKALEAQWKKDPNFLLEEYKNLLYDVALSELTLIWPPLLKTE